MCSNPPRPPICMFALAKSEALCAAREERKEDQEDKEDKEVVYWRDTRVYIYSSLYI